MRINCKRSRALRTPSSKISWKLSTAKILSHFSRIINDSYPDIFVNKFSQNKSISFNSASVRFSQFQIRTNFTYNLSEPKADVFCINKFWSNLWL